ncbi:MAG: arginine repressor [Clostridia bacterium]|nr:arginine repressor [Clostridia bacterium]
MTKADRHRKILELISTRVVSTQTDLTNLLTEAGFDVTQATTSRDLQELRIIKVLLSDGTYKYTASRETDSDINGKLRKILGECLISADYAVNIVVLKTITGAAQAVAFALESVVNDDIVGSIAGDDTIMIVVRNEKNAKLLAAKLTKYIG